MLDIIIPILNEEKILEERESYFLGLKNKARLIFVDGGSTDRSMEIARNYGDVITSERGRCFQLNAGARTTRSPAILFLHADTVLSPEAVDNMERVLGNGADSGCFTLSIEDPRFIFRIFESLVNFRARAFGVIDGDLGFGVKREVFEKVGGYDAVPVMEDILISKKIRRAGRVAVLPDVIFASSRKWQERGFLKTFILYTKAYLFMWSRR